MDHSTMLMDVLKLHFGWHLARIKCLSYLIVALFKVRTVNLAEVATALPGTVEIDSHYGSLGRFLFALCHLYVIFGSNKLDVGLFAD